MKDFFQDDQQDLVHLLRQHRPLPPKENPHLENHIMELIHQTAQEQPQGNNFNLLTAISGTIAVGLVVTWGTSRWLEPAPQMAIEKDILETFLVNNWESTVHDSTFFFSPEESGYWSLSNVESSEVLSQSH